MMRARERRTERERARERERGRGKKTDGNKGAEQKVIRTEHKSEVLRLVAGNDRAAQQQIRSDLHIVL